MPGYFLDNFRHPYLRFDDRFIWPSIHLIRPLDEEILAVREIMEQRFPGFDSEFAYWENDPFSGNQKYLIFVASPDYLRSQGLLFEIRVLAAYAGGALGEEIRRPAEQDRSPAFETDRIYFKGFLFPIDEFVTNSARRVEQIVVRTFQEILEASRYTLSLEQKSIWATALFDSIDYTFIQDRLRDTLSKIVPWKPGGLFPPIIIERMTFCLHTLDLLVARHMAPAFREYVEKIQDEQLEDLVHREDWIWFNQYLSLERIASRAGNPHWQFVKNS